MQGFYEAQKIYERRLTSPYDFGGGLFDWDKYEKEKEENRDYLENEGFDSLHEAGLL